jgi:hypothetical protein
MKSSDVIWALIATLCVGAMAPLAAGTAGGLDWQGDGALAAAPRMAQAADPGRAEKLIGHWRNTRIVFGSPLDEHMVFRGDGSVERWSVTASGRSGTVRGRWGTQANILGMEWEDGSQWSRPFTFHDGNLVFPNVPNQRKFWERIG